jgi:hypothetical protein
MKLTAQLHFMPRSRMKGTVTLFSHTPSWLAPGNFMLFISVLFTVCSCIGGSYLDKK